MVDFQPRDRRFKSPLEQMRRRRRVLATRIHTYMSRPRNEVASISSPCHLSFKRLFSSSPFLLLLLLFLFPSPPPHSPLPSSSFSPFILFFFSYILSSS